MSTITLSTTMLVIECYKCHVLFALTTEHVQRLGETHTDFYCPAGHAQRYCDETEAERLRRGLSAESQEKARLAGELERTQTELRETTKKLIKMKGRIGKGVCPYCKRSFAELGAHITHKHPECRH
jgi:hypothetical protein